MTTYYLPTGNPASETRGISNSVRTEFTLIATGFSTMAADLVSGLAGANDNAALRGLIAGQTWTGTHDYTGATLQVPTKSVGSSGNYAASVDYVNAVAFSVVLPGQAGKAGYLLSTDSSSASFSNLIKTVNLLADNADSTKRVGFNLASLTTATTRTVYAPDRDVTLGGFCNMVVLRTTQTWTPPAGITRAEITVADGGYSSTAHTNTTFTGGNGGAASISVRAVSPSVTYTATIGAGGVGGAAGTDTASVAGGASSFSGTGLTTLTSSNGDLSVPGGTAINSTGAAYGGASLYALVHTLGNGVSIGQGASSSAQNAAANTGAAGGIIIRY